MRSRRRRAPLGACQRPIFSSRSGRSRWIAARAVERRSQRSTSGHCGWVTTLGWRAAIRASQGIGSVGPVGDRAPFPMTPWPRSPSPRSPFRGHGAPTRIPAERPGELPVSNSKSGHLRSDRVGADERHLGRRPPAPPFPPRAPISSRGAPSVHAAPQRERVAEGDGAVDGLRRRASSRGAMAAGSPTRQAPGESRQVV